MNLTKPFLRLAIAAGFLSAVADRFGCWPAAKSAWGAWQPFLDYVAQINWWAPAALVPTLGVVATAAEIIFAVLLLLGFKTRITAILSGLLLLSFAITMGSTPAVGIKSVFDYSVLSAAAASFALAALPPGPWELDSLFSRNKRDAA